mgnify:CR=1 FL=1
MPMPGAPGAPEMQPVPGGAPMPGAAPASGATPAGPDKMEMILGIVAFVVTVAAVVLLALMKVE